jgi:hypothetical protein
MASKCSFCKRKLGEGVHDGILRVYDAMSERSDLAEKVDFRKLADRLREQPDRKVQLILPGPGDIHICDVCIDLYADTVKRELAARG